MIVIRANTEFAFADITICPEINYMKISSNKDKTKHCCASRVAFFFHENMFRHILEVINKNQFVSFPPKCWL